VRSSCVRPLTFGDIVEDGVPLSSQRDAAKLGDRGFGRPAFDHHPQAAHAAVRCLNGRPELARLGHH
jgi:hypothetical protein